MLGDQIVTASPQAIGVRTIVKSLRVRYRRPLPLGEELALWGVCEPVDDFYRARFTVSLADRVAVEGEGELVTFEHFDQRARGEGRE
jgi:hypothetical protein